MKLDPSKTYFLDGWGIKDDYRHNGWGDIWALKATVTKTGKLRLGWIKSNAGSSKVPYVRFMTEADAQAFCDILNKQDPSRKAIPYKSKVRQYCELIDKNNKLFTAMWSTNTPFSTVADAISVDKYGNDITNLDYSHLSDTDLKEKLLKPITKILGAWDYGKMVSKCWDSKLEAFGVFDSSYSPTIGINLDELLSLKLCTAIKTYSSVNKDNFTIKVDPDDEHDPWNYQDAGTNSCLCLNITGLPEYDNIIFTSDADKSELCEELNYLNIGDIAGWKFSKYPYKDSLVTRLASKPVDNIVTIAYTLDDIRDMFKRAGNVAALIDLMKAHVLVEVENYDTNAFIQKYINTAFKNTSVEDFYKKAINIISDKLDNSDIIESLGEDYMEKSTKETNKKYNSKVQKFISLLDEDYEGNDSAMTITHTADGFYLTDNDEVFTSLDNVKQLYGDDLSAYNIVEEGSEEAVAEPEPVLEKINTKKYSTILEELFDLYGNENN